MGRFVEGEDRSQSLLLPESLDDYVGEDNPVRVIEAFIEALDLSEIGFYGMTPAVTGRPAYHPSTMLKIYLYGYLSVQGVIAISRYIGRGSVIIGRRHTRHLTACIKVGGAADELRCAAACGGRREALDD